MTKQNGKQHVYKEWVTELKLRVVSKDFLLRLDQATYLCESEKNKWFTYMNYM